MLESKSIDTADALSAPGVVAVYTGADVADKIGPVPCASALPDLKVPDHRVLAKIESILSGIQSRQSWPKTVTPQETRSIS